ncbi:MAG: 30S ribosomal protein S27 [Candidatus Muirbacterium halophilum]|nr:30S ribosomal protein S27 [Candidatus Muirbacterium halophilum]MCK9474852.1 30S ribosomal protein S27 [Candidatus Muirbacterium halophilum]
MHIFIFFAQLIESLVATKRKCPDCGKKQKVNSGNKNKSVNCKFCGSEIPPNKF